MEPFLKIPMPGLYPRFTESESLGRDPGVGILKCSPGNSKVQQGLSTKM